MLRLVSTRLPFKRLRRGLTCDHSSYSQHELLQTSDPASNRGVRDFGLVHWHDHNQETNAKTTDSATRVEEVQVLACGLQGTSEAENDGTNHDSQPPAEQVTTGPCKSGSEESATGEQRHYSTTLYSLVSSVGRMQG